MKHIVSTIILSIALLATGIQAYGGARLELAGTLELEPSLGLSVFGEHNNYGVSITNLDEGVLFCAYKENYFLVSLIPLLPDSASEVSKLGLRIGEQHGAGYLSGYERLSFIVSGSIGVYYRWAEVYVRYTAMSYVHDSYQRTLSSVSVGIAFEYRVLP